MTFREYQNKALLADQLASQAEGDNSIGIIVPLLGLAGEAGELLTEYKKFLRDREAHSLLKDRVAEELGDLLWYVANVASKFNLDLDDIAERNLRKVRGR